MLAAQAQLDQLGQLVGLGEYTKGADLFPVDGWNATAAMKGASTRPA